MYQGIKTMSDQPPPNAYNQDANKKYRRCHQAWLILWSVRVVLRETKSKSKLLHINFISK
jgi:hypothetical protein